MKALQNHTCFICKEGAKQLYVDHNHETGKVRRLLCPRCNTLVGYIERNPELLPTVEKYIREEGA